MLGSSVLPMEANVPSLLALLVCDTAITDQETKKTTLVGLFHDIWSAGIPFMQRTAFFARLTDMEGEYSFTMIVVRLTADGEQKIAEGGLAPVKVTDRLLVTDIALNLPPTTFPEYGKYEFQLFFNGSYLGRATLNCHKQNPCNESRRDHFDYGSYFLGSIHHGLCGPAWKRIYQDRFGGATHDARPHFIRGPSTSRASNYKAVFSPVLQDPKRFHSFGCRYRRIRDWRNAL